MFCVLIYDIATKDEKDYKRLEKVYNTCKKYLQHIEFSVFYGEINRAQLKLLIKELKYIMDKDNDSIIIYLFKSKEDIEAIIKFNINEFSNVL